MSVDVKGLVARLTPAVRGALEQAAGLTLSRTHYNVEIEHWLLKLAEIPNGDLRKVFARYEADIERFVADLNRGIEKFKTGNGRAPSLAPSLVRLIQQAWLLASIDHGAGQVRSGHVLRAILDPEGFALAARETSSQLARIPADAFKRDFAQATEGSSESAESTSSSEAGFATAPASAAGRGALDLYTADLTARAKAGKIDPVLGRDDEIRQCIDILTRRRQNNPILTGEAGVGKTAVVEGLANRIAVGDVPPMLAKCVIRSLDLGLLQAGAGVKGEFENRLNGVIADIKASATPIILFIDEAHMLIGAGGQAGQGDAANLLKPALARGELRTIAATTWAEYKKYFERDAALTRRFQVVKVEEPSENLAVAMLRGLVSTLETHHKVRILDEALQEAVKLSSRYVSGRQLPDKAIGVLDTACARVAMAHAATPAPLEDARRQLSLLATKGEILGREASAGTDHARELDQIAKDVTMLTAEAETLERRWHSEREAVSELTSLRTALEAGGDAPALQAKRDSYRQKLAEVKAMQGEAPLVPALVDGAAVAAIVADWTGIPVGRMRGDEVKTVLELKEAMAARVIGQDHALDLIARTVRTARAGLADPRKPLGVFLLVGPSGTGKTETALCLAELLYGGDQNLTVINMSEFKEEHKVSMLVGSPPGYVGYGEGGVLTEAVRRKPYSVLLLDEVEKAHPGVQDVFYQVFDKGSLRDGEGRDIDFRNTMIVLTSNAASDVIAKLCVDPDTRPTQDGLAEAIRPQLLSVFKPAFLGRTTVIPYFPLDDATIRRIVRLQLERVRRRYGETYKAAFDYDPAVVEAIASRCREVESGARNVEQIISRNLLPELSAQILHRMAEGRPVGDARVALGDNAVLVFDLK